MCFVYFSGLKNNMASFFGVDDDETMEKWKDRVERMHATSRLVGRGYKPRGDTPLPDTSSVFGTPVTRGFPPVTAPASGGLRHIRDPLHRHVILCAFFTLST